MRERENITSSSQQQLAHKKMTSCGYTYIPSALLSSLSVSHYLLLSLNPQVNKTFFDCVSRTSDWIQKIFFSLVVKGRQIYCEIFFLVRKKDFQKLTPSDFNSSIWCLFEWTRRHQICYSTIKLKGVSLITQ